MTLRLLLAAGEGLVTRACLHGAGLGQRWIHRRIRTGILAPVLPGVLRSSEVLVDDRLRVRAGLLQVGPDAALTHATALWNWGLLDEPPEDVHLCVPRGRTREIGFVRLHVQRSRDIVTHNGLPTVSAADAVAAAAADLELNRLRFSAMEGSRTGLLTADDLLRGRPRTLLGPLGLLAEEVAAGAESGGEAIHWRLLHDSHLPTPELQKWIETDQGPRRVDAYWEEFLLATEIDGRQFHAQNAAFETDRRRQNSIHATGVVLIRYSVSTVINDQAYVLEDTEANMEARRAFLRDRGRARGGLSGSF